MAVSHLLANVSETCAIVSALEAPLLRRFERESLTPRQLKYLEDGGVLQALRTSTADGRLYSAVEIALVRLWLRIQGAALPDYAARAALAYLGPALRSELARDASDKVLVMHGLRGELLPLPAALRVKAKASCWIPLEAIRRGVHDRLLQLRTEAPFIRTGLRVERGSTLATQVVSVV